MAVVSSHIDVPVDDVWAVLCDPFCYKDWVVGAKDVRDATADWPQPGSTLYHSVGVGPANIKDSTTVLEMKPKKMLLMRGRVRPIGLANITLQLESEGEGTRVVMIERVVGGPVQKLYGRLLDMLMRGRNRETLRRLEHLAKERSGT